MTVLGACVLDPADQPSDPAVQSTSAELAQLDDPAAPSEAAELALAPVEAAAANCSVIGTCNAPGPDGTRCRQQAGCSAGAAALECALESTVVCGTPICPVILIRLDGTRQNLCQSGRP